VLRVALTGGIATGKSYVRARMEASGVPTIDADVLARDVVAPGRPALAAIVGRFGASVLRPDGALDRAALAREVFASAGARRDLEHIVHPAVYDAISRWLTEAAARGQADLAVADIPLLYETGRQGDFDAVVVTACDPEVQVQRVVARDGAAADQARQRLAAQWPIADKVALADYVIDTGGTFEETDRQVDAVLESLRRRARAPR
jgi:dephospho-CoA kinase